MISIPLVGPSSPTTGKTALRRKLSEACWRCAGVSVRTMASANGSFGGPLAPVRCSIDGFAPAS